jgi:hypothetical protein
MRKIAVLVLIAATLAPHALSAKGGGIKVLNSIPDVYWGRWAPGVESCNDGDTEALLLSGKAYAGPLGKCDIASVSEIPNPKGSTYSARLQCTDPSRAQKKTPTNLIIRPGEANQISVGPGFDSLKAYQRCSESAPAPK